jgi:hypothetical protein
MLPASLTVPGGLNEVFQVRDRPTFHRFLDMLGASLLDLDPCFRAAEQAAFHLANTLVRAAKIFEGRPGGEVIEPVLLGTARVFQYTTGLSMVENRVLGPLASSFVFDKFLNKLSQNTQSAPVTPFASKSPASGNLLQMFSTMFSGATSWAKVTMKAVKKMALKILKKQTTRAASTGVRPPRRPRSEGGLGGRRDVINGQHRGSHPRVGRRNALLGRASAARAARRGSCSSRPAVGPAVACGAGAASVATG